jgi:hypothetical protein
MSTYINDYENQKKLTDTSYASRAFNDYENLMNNIDDEINELFKTIKYDEQPRKLKQFNDEKEDYTQENRVISSLTKERRKKEEERNRKLGLLNENLDLLKKPTINNLGLEKLESTTPEEIKENLRMFFDNEKKTPSHKKFFKHKNKSVIPPGLKNINPFNPNENNNSNNNNDDIDKE